jgi:hypothetical protein
MLTQGDAISESIGNKKYILHEECDECNDYFSRTIELDFLEMFSLEIQAFNIKGKKRKVPKIKKKKWGIVYDSSDTPDSQIKMYTGENPIPPGKSQVPYGEFIPQNVYKALAKYAISIVKKEYLPIFKRTIAWIKDESNFKNELPEILIAYSKQDSFNFYVFEDKYGYVGHLIAKRFAIVFQIPTFETKNTVVDLKKYLRLRQRSVSEKIESIYVQDISENRPVIGTLTVSNEI